MEVKSSGKKRGRPVGAKGKPKIVDGAPVVSIKKQPQQKQITVFCSICSFGDNNAGNRIVLCEYWFLLLTQRQSLPSI